MKKLALIGICLISIIVLQQGFIFLLVALLPTLVAFYKDIVDEDPQQNCFKVVFACNFAAILPSLSVMLNTIMHTGHYDIAPLMADMRNWLIVYSGAGFGWCLIYLCRAIARVIVRMLYNMNIASLENVQKDLQEEWGPQIRQAAEKAA